MLISLSALGAAQSVRGSCLYVDLAARAGKNPAKSAVARKVLIAAWHVLSRQQPFTPPARRPN